MQFYQNSTKNKEQQQGFQAVPQSKQISGEENSKRGASSVTDSQIFQHYCREFFQISLALNSELIKNAQLIEVQSKQWKRNCSSQSPNEFQKASSKVSDNGSTQAPKSNFGTNVILAAQQINQQIQANATSKRRKKTDMTSSDEYEPNEEEYCLDDPGITKISESKNIPKNYSKAIFNFIKGHPEFTKKVLSYLDEDYQEFMRALNSLGGHVCSIAQLQWLWSGHDNPYAKAYRILSLEYLRKHSLAYIFNSRVNIFGKHIKYRSKMLQGVSKPESFTRMKEF